MNKFKVFVLVGTVALCALASGNGEVSKQVAEEISQPVSYFDEQSTDSYIYAYRLSHQLHQENEEALSERILNENMDKIKRGITKREAKPWPGKSIATAKIVPKPAGDIITSGANEDIHIFPDLSRQSRKLFTEPKTFLSFGVEDAIENPGYNIKSRPKRSAKPGPFPFPARQRSRLRKKENTTTEATNSESNTVTQRSNKQYVAPPPREIVKFELADAKLPETESARPGRERNLQKPAEESVSRSKGKTVFKRNTVKSANDQSTLESRKIKIMTPLSRTKVKHQLYEELPMSVQKAIDSAVLDYRKKHKGGYEDGYLRFYYGDKIIKAPRNYKAVTAEDEAEDIHSKWAPIVKTSQPLVEIKTTYPEKFKASPQFSGPKHKPMRPILVRDSPIIPLKLKNFASEPTYSLAYEHSFDKLKLFEPEPEPITFSTIISTTPTTTIPLNLPDDKPYSYATFKTPKGGYEITEEVDEKIPELAALIGEKPTNQLKKLNEMLMKEKNDPKKSTAPVQFPTTSARPLTTPITPSSIDPPKSYALLTTEDDPHEYKYIVPQYVNMPPKFVKEYVPITEDLSGNYEMYQPMKMKAQEKPIKIVHPVTVPPHEDPTKKYEFGYRVSDFKTGNNFAHTQKSEKDGVTSGEYHILLPDGRVQNVHYHADDDGFHADVSYSSIHE